MTNIKKVKVVKKGKKKSKNIEQETLKKWFEEETLELNKPKELKDWKVYGIPDELFGTPVEENLLGQDIIQQYCNIMGTRLARNIDREISIIVNPKPKWCPNWLYKKIIKSSVEIHQIIC